MPSESDDDSGDPWRSRPSNSPPNFEILINHQLNSFKKYFSLGGYGKMCSFLLLIVVGLTIGSSYYIAPSESVAVVQRFGKYLKEVQPGLHFKWPLAVDKATYGGLIGTVK